MNIHDFNVKNCLKTGTSQAKVFYPMVFSLAGIFFVLFGFWKAMFIIAMGLIGYAIGSTQDLGKAISKGIDKVYPPKNQKITYSAEDLNRVKKACEGTQESDKTNNPEEKQN